MSERVEKLIEKMTLEEKARQLTQVNAVVIHAEIAAEVTGAQQGIEICREDAAGIGSVLNFDTASEAIAIQDEYLNASPHAIPLIFMQDVVHGYRTIFLSPWRSAVRLIPLSPRNVQKCRPWRQNTAVRM